MGHLFLNYFKINLDGSKRWYTFDLMKESFKIDSEIKKRLGKQAKQTGRTMTGLANMILDSKLKEMESGYHVYGNDYTNNMTPMLGEAINPTRKNKRK